MKFIPLALVYALTFAARPARADEQSFGFVRGAETLPGGHAEGYQFVTLRTGKDTGTYYGSDYETEVEYGFTDKFQASLSIENHDFYNQAWMVCLIGITAASAALSFPGNIDCSVRSRMC